MEQISLKVTSEQKKLIKMVALEKGLNVASLCRFIVLREIKKEGEDATS